MFSTALLRCKAGIREASGKPGTRVLEPGREWTGRALGITDTGELIVEAEDGEIREVGSGEVSVRGVYGYV